MPVEAHSPTPHVVGVEGMPSSTAPLQSSSMPLHVSADGVPGTQESTITPPTQDSVPVEAHSPIPQVVGVGI